MGLETAERLREDLRTNLARNLTGDDRHIREELDKLEAEKDQAERTATRTKDTRTRKGAELDHIRSDIQEMEDKIAGLGGGYAKKRQDMRERLASREAEAAIISRRIGVLCAAELPFGMIPRQVDEVLKQMDAGSDRIAARHENKDGNRHTAKSSGCGRGAEHTRCRRWPYTGGDTGVGPAAG